MSDQLSAETGPVLRCAGRVWLRTVGGSGLDGSSVLSQLRAAGRCNWRGDAVLQRPERPAPAEAGPWVRRRVHGRTGDETGHGVATRAAPGPRHREIVRCRPLA